MSLPIVAGAKDVHDGFGHNGGRDEREPEENDPAGGRETSLESKRAEVRVEGEDHAIFLLGEIQENIIIGSGMRSLCPGDIVTVLSESRLSESRDDVPRDVLVYEKPHYGFEVDTG